MQFKYWDEKAKEENSVNTFSATEENFVTVSEDIVEAVSDITEEAEIKEPESSANIVSFDDAKKVKEEEKEYEQQEIDEFFKTEEKKEKKSRTAKYIFVDGLLGIPFLTVCDLIISAFVALFFVVAVAFLAAFIVVLCGSVLTIGFGFTVLPGRIPTGLALVAIGILALAISLLFFLLAIAFGLRVMPWTAKLAVRLENKIHLFRE